MGYVAHMVSRQENLGTFLKDRRGRLNPSALGLSATRRRTAGLRREEVAQRAHVSVTWYTWLEQGRGGAPSADVLNRLARALDLTEEEREHMFLLAQHRPPEPRFSGTPQVDTKLQAILDAFREAPAFIRDSMWNVLAWNRAALAVLTDYEALEFDDRNALRLLFCDASTRRKMPNWNVDVRAAVASFRREVARNNAVKQIGPLIDELYHSSPEFAEIWESGDVGALGLGRKVLDFKGLGRVLLDYSAFSVDGRPELGMIVYNPATEEDRRIIRALIGQRDIARH